MSTLRILFLIPLFPAVLHAQDSLVIISPLVGPVIDWYEAAQFDVLKAFPDLLQASFALTPEGQYRAMIVTRSSGVQQETTFTLSAVSIRNLHARIDHRRELEAGIYGVMFDTCAIAIASREPRPVGPKKAWIAPRPMPHFDIGPPLESPHPAFSFHIGLTHIVPRVEGMEKVVGEVEHLLQEQGYSVFPQAREPSLDPILILYGFGVTVNDELSLTIETGRGSKNAEMVNQDSWFGSVSLLYTPPVLNLGWVRFGLAASAFGWGNSMTVKYPYNTASAPDSSGGKLIFRGITFESASRRFGGSYQLVGDLLVGGLPLLTAYMRYSSPVPITIPTPELVRTPEGITVDLPRLSGGVRLSIQL